MTTLLIFLAAVLIAYFAGMRKGLEIGREEGTQYVIEVKRKK